MATRMISATEVRSASRTSVPVLALGLLIVTALACNIGSRPTPEPTRPVPLPTHTAAPIVTLEASPEPTAQVELDLVGMDPCSLVTAEQVGAALGAQAEALPPGAEGQVPVTCGFSTADFSAFVTIQLYQESAGKRSLLDLYGQLTEAQACSYSVSFTSEDVTPTPLPAEVEAHMEEGFDEIYRMYWGANRRFCGEGGTVSELVPWPELGPQAYASKGLSPFLGGSIPAGNVQILQPDTALVINVTGTADAIDGDLLERYNDLIGSDSADPAELEEVGQQLFEQLDGLVEIAQAIARAAFGTPQ